MINPGVIFQPFLDSLVSREGQYFCRGNIPIDCVYTDGHFPNNPVLPAVALIDGSIEILKKIIDSEFKEYTVKMAKFTNIIPPNNPIEIILKSTTDKNWQIDWHLTSGLCASIEFELH